MWPQIPNSRTQFTESWNLGIGRDPREIIYNPSAWATSDDKFLYLACRTRVLLLLGYYHQEEGPPLTNH